MFKIKFIKKNYKLEKHVKFNNGCEIIIESSFDRLKDALEAINHFNNEVKEDDEQTRWCALVYPRV